MGRMTRQDPFRRPPDGAIGKTGGISGGAVLMCAAAALCVTALCLLSLARVQASSNLTEKAFAEASGYYDALLAANTDIADARLDGVEGTFRKTYPISDTQLLVVEAGITQDGRCSITECRAVPADTWSADSRLHVAGWDE